MFGDHDQNLKPFAISMTWNPELQRWCSKSTIESFTGFIGRDLQKQEKVFTCRKPYLASQHNCCWWGVSSDSSSMATRINSMPMQFKTHHSRTHTHTHTHTQSHTHNIYIKMFFIWYLIHIYKYKQHTCTGRFTCPCEWQPQCYCKQVYIYIHTYIHIWAFLISMMHLAKTPVRPWGTQKYIRIAHVYTTNVHPLCIWKELFLLLSHDLLAVRKFGNWEHVKLQGHFSELGCNDLQA
jgi:hypothetical protein